jgi:hypothetical protein
MHCTSIRERRALWKAGRVNSMRRRGGAEEDAEKVEGAEEEAQWDEIVRQC